MAIEIMIKRRVKQGVQAKKPVPLILQMRSLAMHQPGDISGTTLSNLEQPEDCLIAAKEMKWEEKSRHWPVKKQNTLSMFQWCPDPTLKKRLVEEQKVFLECKVNFLGRRLMAPSHTRRHIHGD